MLEAEFLALAEKQGYTCAGKNKFKLSWAIFMDVTDLIHLVLPIPPLALQSKLVTLFV